MADCDKYPSRRDLSFWVFFLHLKSRKWFLIIQVNVSFQPKYSDLFETTVGKIRLRTLMLHSSVEELHKPITNCAYFRQSAQPLFKRRSILQLINALPWALLCGVSQGPWNAFLSRGSAADTFLFRNTWQTKARPSKALVFRRRSRRPRRDAG